MRVAWSRPTRLAVRVPAIPLTRQTSWAVRGWALARAANVSAPARSVASAWRWRARARGGDRVGSTRQRSGRSGDSVGRRSVKEAH
jgi:hypothetical protein